MCAALAELCYTIINYQHGDKTMSYKRNPQLITSYDRITASQVVLGQTSPERYVSAQPSGLEAVLVENGKSWRVSDLSKGSYIADVGSLKQVKQVIADYHNKAITDFFAEAAVAWVDYYQKHPLEKARANPQLIESIYRCAANSRVHPKDQTKVS